MTSITFALGASAQEAATPPAAEPVREGIEEIIVTGTKRSQVSKNVPIGITAISEAMIDSQFRTDVLALGEMTPGVALGYATEFVPGGFTECSSLTTCNPFDSETNWNVEVGFKGQFLDNTVQTNAAVFFTQCKDLIRSQVVPFTDPFGLTTQETINVNAGVSQAAGIELEGTWLATEGLSFSGNFAYLHHEYDEFILDGNDLSDLKVPFSPKFKWGLTSTYEHQIAWGSLAWNLIYSHQHKAEMSVLNSPRTQMSQWDTIDANVTFRPENERYFFTIWAKNLTDARTRLAANSVAGLWNFTVYGRPRSYGFEVGVHFGE